MHGFANPQGLLCVLYEAQGGLCFHCSKPMQFFRSEGMVKAALATREHIFPKGNHLRDCQNGYVLAHAGCNHQRGNRPATDEEIGRAVDIYKSVGLTAFSPRDEHGLTSKYPSAENKHRGKMCDAALKRANLGLGIWKREVEIKPPVVLGGESGRDRFIADWAAKTPAQLDREAFWSGPWGFDTPNGLDGEEEEA